MQMSLIIGEFGQKKDAKKFFLRRKNAEIKTMHLEKKDKNKLSARSLLAERGVEKLGQRV